MTDFIIDPNNGFIIDPNNGLSEVVYTKDFPRNKKAALKLAIKKWEFIVEHLSDKNTDIVPAAGTISCPLCQLYFDNGCEKCPVLEKTGIECCDKTPIVQYEDTTHTGEVKLALKAAKQEVVFLTKLYRELYE